MQNKKGKQTVNHNRIKITKGLIPFALRLMRNQLFLPDEEQDELAIACLGNKILDTSIGNASPTSDPRKTDDSSHNNISGVHQTRRGRNVKVPGYLIVYCR